MLGLFPFLYWSLFTLFEFVFFRIGLFRVGILCSYALGVGDFRQLVLYCSGILHRTVEFTSVDFTFGENAVNRSSIALDY